MIVPLRSADAGTCGGKAGALGALLRAGLPVPDGFVVPFAAYRAVVRDLDLGPDRRRAIEALPVQAALIDALGHALGELGDPPVAVRSSAAHEDTGLASAAGQHDSFLAVRGAGAVADAVRACWASLFTPRAIDYHRGAAGDLAMAVLVQRHLDAEASGVMFTSAGPDDPIRIEASWGLGPSVVGGTVTPDAYRVAGDGTVTRALARKRTRLDRRGDRLVTSDVPAGARDQPSIDDATASLLAELGRRIAAVRGGPQDVEWAIADGRPWILQARPVTATPPAWPSTPALAAALIGTPGSHGVATGTARIIRGPRDFARARPGDIIVCPFTDPAWTPLLRIAAGVVTETGGVLSHAAIVAREHGIPAVLGIPDATTRLHDDSTITIDGTTGTVTDRKETGSGPTRAPRPTRS
ncbi:PEP/pyruvate-binding domain-containing protein [Nonomuraea sp. LP-02]|uniref:PEP/pyruvate-binding domain-containing protein n=1 Tax=Nonomuraea sp. LP-02 TaxID=3097960 RepID=UPI002E2FF829|nr:PEP/pyruvate-binding domain-containing protein [Nonomuraea sp. LP-02]MED7931593.1 PEP/pyruvate-binding domain-containing protein [Nonomuraea sp. LP-02]